MFFLDRRSRHEIDRFLAACNELPFSYGAVGLATAASPAASIDEQIAIIGSGAAAFARAKVALREWPHVRLVELRWVELFPSAAAPHRAPGL